MLMSRRARGVAAIAGLTLGLGAAITIMAGLGRAGQQPADQGEQQADQGDIGAMLYRGLMGTPGCLGVDSGQTRTDKNFIIAWFKDAEAARAWYHSPVHQRMVDMVGGSDRQPLEHVEDDTPVMVIATITMAEKPEIEGVPMPISQISIELYTPLPGGAMINGRMAPADFPVEHMADYTNGG